VLSQAPRPYVNKRHDKSETEINSFIAHTTVASEIPYGVKFSAVVLGNHSQNTVLVQFVRKKNYIKEISGRKVWRLKKIRNVTLERSIKAVRTR
jgi:hypothetical protein